MRMIATEPHGRVMILRLDRPAKKNALTPGMLGSLAKAVETAASAGALVLSGVGDTFCAGFDLTLTRTDDTALAAMLAGLSRAAAALRDAACPVVASAHGAAVAGGCALLCACDVVVTHAGARLGYPAVRLGISPAVSGPMLGAAAGWNTVRSRLLDPGLIDGEEAVRAGLAGECVESAAACEARAIEIAEALAGKPGAGVGHTKRWLTELDGTLEAGPARTALEASLAGVNSPEQRAMLARAWERA